VAHQEKTAFDRYFAERMGARAFASEYRDARAEIGATDTLIRALDAARKNAGLSKAELARRMDAKPEILRRLFTAKGNPTMSTVLKVVAALDCHLELAPNLRKPARQRSRGAIRVPRA